MPRRPLRFGRSRKRPRWVKHTDDVKLAIADGELALARGNANALKTAERGKDRAAHGRQRRAAAERGARGLKGRGAPRPLNGAKDLARLFSSRDLFFEELSERFREGDAFALRTPLNETDQARRQTHRDERALRIVGRASALRHLELCITNILDRWTRAMDALLTGLHPMNFEHDDDIELRLVEPSKNRFRLYALSECRTLFGELCLRIVWGRIGNRRPRERSETFRDRDALERRRRELLALRMRHGYVPQPRRRGGGATPVRRTVESEIVEAHGLRFEDSMARRLVHRWERAARALRDYLVGQRPEEAFDLDDVSTLAAMYASAIRVA